MSEKKEPAVERPAVDRPEKKLADSTLTGAEMLEAAGGTEQKRAWELRRDELRRASGG